MIPFNRPHVTGREIEKIAEAIRIRKLAGDGTFTKYCQDRIEALLGSGRSFLTTSCTDALEAAAILADVGANDEVIVPDYTFVSTANAFALRGARIKFADSSPHHPNMDVGHVESLITDRTKAICAVHYAGVCVDMDGLRDVAKSKRIVLIEDAAQAITSRYKTRPAGTLGALAAFSFHETKNINSGEGGSLHVNAPDLVHRAEVVREKGTNRSAFFRGDIDKYGWVDIGSSFLPSELIAAFLAAQLDEIDGIQARRLMLWDLYREHLAPVERAGVATLPMIPEWATHNAHMFYIVVESLDVRTNLIAFLRERGVMATFHYQPLHKSRYFIEHGTPVAPLLNSIRFGDCLVRLPLFHDLSADDIDRIAGLVREFFAV
jgi:dTDP-4-amino-4,6-dideoxygalactose transaminase